MQIVLQVLGARERSLRRPTTLSAAWGSPTGRASAASACSTATSPTPSRPGRSRSTTSTSTSSRPGMSWGMSMPEWDHVLLSFQTLKFEKSCGNRATSEPFLRIICYTYKLQVKILCKMLCALSSIPKCILSTFVLPVYVLRRAKKCVEKATRQAVNDRESPWLFNLFSARA